VDGLDLVDAGDGDGRHLSGEAMEESERHPLQTRAGGDRMRGGRRIRDAMPHPPTAWRRPVGGDPCSGRGDGGVQVGLMLRCAMKISTSSSR
jgi:hypothetical protein